MYLVDIRMEPGDLSRQMSAMRIWLDERRFEPSTFSCRDTDCGMLVSVEFKVPREAEAFAEHFDGRTNGRGLLSRKNWRGRLSASSADEHRRSASHHE
jgi:hypothetical protein